MTAVAIDQEWIDSLKPHVEGWVEWRSDCSKARHLSEVACFLDCALDSEAPEAKRSEALWHAYYGLCKGHTFREGARDLAAETPLFRRFGAAARNLGTLAFDLSGSAMIKNARRCEEHHCVFQHVVTFNSAISRQYQANLQAPRLALTHWLNDLPPEEFSEALFNFSRNPDFLRLHFIDSSVACLRLLKTELADLNRMREETAALEDATLPPGATAAPGPRL